MSTPSRFVRQPLYSGFAAPGARLAFAERRLSGRSPDERSEIRVVVAFVPGFRCAHPGYKARPRHHPRNQKAGTGPAVLSKWFCSCWEPGRSEAPPGLEKLLLLGLLGLLRLFRLLRFLSHGILSRFNGWKRDTRHARRRASLATSSNAIPTDSRRAAPYCHAPVIALSTAVMRFGAFFAAVRRSAPKNPYSRERSQLARDPRQG